MQAYVHEAYTLIKRSMLRVERGDIDVDEADFALGGDDGGAARHGLCGHHAERLVDDGGHTHHVGAAVEVGEGVLGRERKEGSIDVGGPGQITEGLLVLGEGVPSVVVAAPDQLCAEGPIGQVGRSGHRPQHQVGTFVGGHLADEEEGERLRPPGASRPFRPDRGGGFD